MLQLALLVGGLLAFGLLCGGQAQAAEGTPSVVTDLTSQVSRTASAVTTPPASTSAPSSPLVVDADRVLRPVREVVTTVTGQVARVAAELPLPSVPELPALPDLGDATDLPDVSEPPALPVQTLPVQPLPVPVTQAPVPDAPVPSTLHEERSRHASPGHEAAHAATVSYGPVMPAPAPVLGGVAGRGAASHSPVPVRAGQVPAPRAPGGVPSGLLSGASALDGGASRHGDTHAVTASYAVPVPLMSGGAVRSGAAETRDRYRDVPVFPG